MIRKPVRQEKEIIRRKGKEMIKKVSILFDYQNYLR